MVQKEKTFQIINFIILLLSILIPIIFFIQTSPEEVKTQTYIIFGTIALVLIVGGFVTYIISKWKNMGKGIEETKKDLEDIKKELNFKELLNKMDIRLTVLENLFLNNKKNKKGQSIDPRIIIWILLIILLYLFLRSIGKF